MNRHSGNSRTARLNQILLIAALLPACGFFVWFALSVLQQRSISFSRGDLVVCGLPGLLLLLIATFGKTPSTLARLALIQWSLLLVLVPAELGLRLAFRHPPAPWGVNTVREITLSVPLEGVAVKGTFTTNELGLRGRSLPLARLKTLDLSVLCVGGSTTECFYNSDKHAWPAVMEQKIAEKTSGEAFVGNAGRGGHIARHHAWQLKHYRYAPEFKIVAVLCGWNDLSAALFATPDTPARDIAAESLTRGVDFTGSAEPHTPFYRNLATGRLLQQVVLRRQWNASANVGWRAVLQDSYGRWVAERREIRKNCIAAGALTSEPANFDKALDGFRTDLEAILSALRPGQVPVFITQPTLCRPELTPEEESRLWSCDGKRAWTAESTALMLNRFNDVTRSFCQQHDLTCVDAETAMSGNSELFYDDCHFSDAGCAVLGTLVAEQVVAVARSNGLLKNN